MRLMSWEGGSKWPRGWAASLCPGTVPCAYVPLFLQAAREQALARRPLPGDS